ncbi:MAG TPA: ABC transporter substrate-binding protein, partial [Acetobacteraceae bacterium]|nr:ABC transporter substrate-binding protein [Acetobacteraceae bacterium]
WKPAFYMTNVAISVGGVLTPAGPEKAIGMLSTQYLKDPTDPAFKDDPGMKQWRDFMAKYMPGGDVTDASYVFAYAVSLTMTQVLKQCKGDFSRANVMKQAESLHDFEVPVTLPGIKINTTHTDHRPITSMQFVKWDGKTWVRFGDLVAGATV